MLAEAILVHGEIGDKFCWLLPFKDWIRRHQLGTESLLKPKTKENEFCTLYEISQALWKSSCVIFRYFCTDSVRFLSPDFLCKLLFSPCNKPMIGFLG